jgi:hypothetical protein
VIAARIRRRRLARMSVASGGEWCPGGHEHMRNERENRQ